ncbi:uncharacterized protein CEXT_163041 [Caerostris extrusa]|uniref:Uncharacterized protein n=1 Tax=Caerostris extrusa TaxID=172846 RepID=A0AAV4Y8D4_CAEEX|nr:uncharacterized protein CEXT_163041 [Caerostris extrusa]
MRKISKPEKKLSTSEKLSKSSHHMPKKDLCWLEKEQQKVDREIIRLSKEKQKFEKRSFRLKQLKEAMTDGDGQKNPEKDASASNQATRSKSGDTLLAGELDVVVNLEPDLTLGSQQEHRDGIHHTEDNYYSLLEENMFLLDQLKDKEEICNHLQNELERLDDKTEKTNRNHQEEIEKSIGKKLWEIHMSRPRDLQGSLHLISELKSRIEELQKCSDKLKSDRERLEESFGTTAVNNPGWLMI